MCIRDRLQHISKGTNILQLSVETEAEEIITNHWVFITPNVESSGEYLVSLFDPFCSLRFRWILKLGGSANKPWKVASCHFKFTINNKLLGMICQKIISYNSKMKVHLLHKIGLSSVQLSKEEVA